MGQSSSQLDRPSQPTPAPTPAEFARNSPSRRASGVLRRELVHCLVDTPEDVERPKKRRKMDRHVRQKLSCLTETDESQQSVIVLESPTRDPPQKSSSAEESTLSECTRVRKETQTLLKRQEWEELVFLGKAYWVQLANGRNGIKMYKPGEKKLPCPADIEQRTPTERAAFIEELKQAEAKVLKEERDAKVALEKAKAREHAVQGIADNNTSVLFQAARQKPRASPQVQVPVERSGKNKKRKRESKPQGDSGYSSDGHRLSLNSQLSPEKAVEHMTNEESKRQLHPAAPSPRQTRIQTKTRQPGLTGTENAADPHVDRVSSSIATWLAGQKDVVEPAQAPSPVSMPPVADEDLDEYRQDSDASDPGSLVKNKAGTFKIIQVQPWIEKSRVNKRRQPPPFSKEEKAKVHTVFNQVVQEEGISPEELMQMIQNYRSAKVFKEKLAAALPDRSSGALRKFAKRKYDPLARYYWTKEEDQELCDAVGTCHGAWGVISDRVGRPEQACQDRWTRRLQFDKALLSEAWTSKDQDVMLDALDNCLLQIKSQYQDPDKYDPEYFENLVNWDQVAEGIGYRKTTQQCRETFAKIKLWCAKAFQESSRPSYLTTAPKRISEGTEDRESKKKRSLLALERVTQTPSQAHQQLGHPVPGSGVAIKKLDCCDENSNSSDQPLDRSDNQLPEISDVDIEPSFRQSETSDEGIKQASPDSKLSLGFQQSPEATRHVGDDSEAEQGTRNANESVPPTAEPSRMQNEPKRQPQTVLDARKHLEKFEIGDYYDIFVETYTALAEHPNYFETENLMWSSIAFHNMSSRFNFTSMGSVLRRVAFEEAVRTWPASYKKLQRKLDNAETIEAQARVLANLLEKCSKGRTNRMTRNYRLNLIGKTFDQNTAITRKENLEKQRRVEQKRVKREPMSDDENEQEDQVHSRHEPDDEPETSKSVGFADSEMSDAEPQASQAESIVYEPSKHRSKLGPLSVNPGEAKVSESDAEYEQGYYESADDASVSHLSDSDDPTRDDGDINTDDEDMESTQKVPETDPEPSQHHYEPNQTEMHPYADTLQGLADNDEVENPNADPVSSSVSSSSDSENLEGTPALSPATFMQRCETAGRRRLRVYGNRARSRAGAFNRTR